MNREYIESSMISSIGYDSNEGILEVEFKTNGHVWQYYDVPEHLWYEITSCGSIGSFFHKNIRGQYTENRVG